MADYNDLKRVIEEISMGVINNRTFSECVIAKLKSVKPLVFYINEKLELSLDYGNLTTPKYRVFRKDEIGKSFIFQKNKDGQQYIYLYECAPQGENGIPYKWTGSLKCNLKGTCPDGDVVVTEGELIEVIHERGLD